mgnify:CR=1 FL=1|tara:strand:+ start:43 stop:501 length:459 start_codon:yes stop_codon:yes gene_type:complete
MGSSNFSSPFFQKSPLQGAYGAGADGMVTVSYADIHKDFQQGIADNVSKAYAKKTSPCDDPLTVQYTEDSVLKKCPKKTAPSTTNSNSTYTMPADLNALADKETKSKPATGASLPSTYDFLTNLGKGIQDEAVENVKKALDPKKNNQIQEKD